MEKKNLQNYSSPGGLEGSESKKAGLCWFDDDDVLEAVDDEAEFLVGDGDIISPS